MESTDFHAAYDVLFLSLSPSLFSSVKHVVSSGSVDGVAIWPSK